MSVSPDSTARAADYLRQLDRDRYLASLVLTGAARPAVQALYAFSADIAAVRDRAREPAPGEIRLQWWLDALRGTEHGAVRQNPLADALLGAIEAFGIPKAPLERLVTARRFDLYDDPMPDLEGFEGYAGETVSVLYQLAAMILGGGGPVDVAEAAGHLGVAHALIGHLRALGFYAARGQIFLPLSILAANGVAESEIFSHTVSEGLLAARNQFCDLAREHLDSAAAAIAVSPKSVRRAFASIVVLKAQLHATQAQAADPFTPPPERPDWQKIAALSWWSFRNG